MKVCSYKIKHQKLYILQESYKTNRVTVKAYHHVGSSQENEHHHWKKVKASLTQRKKAYTILVLINSKT